MGSAEKCASPALVAYHLEKGGMPLREAFGSNCKKEATIDVIWQVPSIWAKGEC